jgi:hypothetical protein
MSELSTQFDYEKIKELVPKDDRDFEREYQGQPSKKEVQRVTKIWDDINEKIDEINREYALVNLKGKAAVLYEAIDPDSLQVDVQFLTISDFHHFHANQLMPNPDKNSRKRKIAASKLWITSPERRQYKGVVFNPDLNEKFEGHYNLYRGLAVEPKKGDWSLMEQHIKQVVANNFLPAYHYIMAWLAQMVQEPGKVISRHGK